MKGTSLRNMEKKGDVFLTFFPNYGKVSLDKFNQMEGEKPHTQPSKSTQEGRRPQGRILDPPTERNNSGKCDTS